MNESELHNKMHAHWVSSTRSWVTALVVVGLVGLGVAVDRCAEGQGRPPALEHARRIWLGPEAVVLDGTIADTGSQAGEGPVAFWAIKDFDLSAEQRGRGGQSARLLVLGDPEVMVYWNGLLVHSEVYQLGQQVTSLNVGPLLEAKNRVILEGRSNTGAGGLLGALWLDLPGEGDTEEIWVTDSSWQVTRQFDPNLLAGFSSLSRVEHLEPARTWNGQDLGRWQPLVIADQPEALSWPSRRLDQDFPSAKVAYQGRIATTGETEPWPSGVLYSFAEPVRGCLAIVAPSLFSRRAFFFENSTSLEDAKGPLEFARDNGQGPAAIGQRVVPVRGSRRWLDASPHSFSSVLLEGTGRRELGSAETVWVQPCAAEDRGLVASQRLRWSQF